ncbi:MAG: TnsA endonuclease N-terminal domain-containing protein [Pyrinomonadaceae bacterium]
MPVRKIPKSYRNVTGLTATEKSGEMAGYESRLEHECQKLLNFNTNVLKYEEQPVTIYFTGDDGKRHRYTPDILIHYRKDIAPAKYWKPLLAEVKWRTNLFKDWRNLKPKFLAARNYVRERGSEFVIITDKEIKIPYLTNATFLLMFRRFPVIESHSNLLLQALDEFRETDPETLLQSISKDRDEISRLLPTLWQLVGNHAVGANLDSILTMRSRIWSIRLQGEVKRDECIYQLRTGRSRRIRWQALRHHSYLEP